MKLPKLIGSIDFSIYLVPILLTIIGITALFSISAGSNISLPLNQAVYFIIGAVVTLIFTFLDYRELKTLSIYVYIASFLLLIFLHFFGNTVFGASRWIDLKFFQIQPSETMKLALLVIPSAILSLDGSDRINSRKNYLVAAYCLIPLYFIISQPDLGTSLVIMFLLFTLYLFSTIKLKHFLAAGLVLLLLLPIGWSSLKPYQKQRLQTFVNPESDPQKSGYNVTQSRIAVGSGGMFGKGFGNATQSQLNFLPVVHTDFIFASWAESTGFAGSILLVLLYCILIWRLLVVALNARDLFGSYLALGIVGIFFFQALVNMGMNIGLLPVTGIPLPFVSYGGTSYLVSSALIGIAQSINIRKRSLKFD